jgi:integrase
MEKKMRGSVYYQSAVLTKVIFFEGAKKINRINPNHEHYQCIASFKTMESYKKIWDNLFNYLKEHFKVKNFELITSEHIKSYIEYKIEYYPSKQYLEKIISAIGKLEIALNKYSKEKYENPIIYDFKIRQELLNNARDLKLVANNYHNRVYVNSIAIINNFKNLSHQIAALIQLEGGARSEGVTLIKEEQLKGFKIDEISKRTVGVIETKEKGGKVGDVLVSLTTYQKLENYFIDNDTKNFKIKYQNYLDDIKNSCRELNAKYQGSHGFRWTFAQNRVCEYQKYEYTYEQALQGVSWEMKHFRASITEHYLG